MIVVGRPRRKVALRKQCMSKKKKGKKANGWLQTVPPFTWLFSNLKGPQRRKVRQTVPIHYGRTRGLIRRKVMINRRFQPQRRFATIRRSIGLTRDSRKTCRRKLTPKVGAKKGRKKAKPICESCMRLRSNLPDIKFVEDEEGPQFKTCRIKPENQLSVPGEVDLECQILSEEKQCSYEPRVLEIPSEEEECPHQIQTDNITNPEVPDSQNTASSVNCSLLWANRLRARQKKAETRTTCITRPKRPRKKKNSEVKPENNDE